MTETQNSEAALELKTGETANEPAEKPKRNIFLFVLPAAYFFLLLILTLFYQIIGDTNPIGEYITVWPPVLWLLGLLPMACLVIVLALRHSRAWRIPVGCTAGLLLYVVINVEIAPVMRGLVSPALPGKNSSTIRLITWNINSLADWQLLPLLEKYSPDICLLQESPSGKLAIGADDLEGPWEGYHIEEAGELLILSRFPLERLSAEPVGPWSPPQTVNVTTPNGDFILCNVRLMLPSLLFAVWDEATRQRFVKDNDLRVAQFGKLATQITQQANSADAPFVIAGDINTGAHAKSLDPLRAVANDAWAEAGRGWGRTMTASFPVARIDQCWLSANLTAQDARVYREVQSDHRLLLVDFVMR